MLSVFATTVSRRIKELHLDVKAEALADLETYYQLLVRWNRTTNLTSLPVETLSPDAIDRLLLEPLSAAPDFPTGEICWVDLGSGGGSPAIPLRIVRPAARLTMVEVRTRKAAFLREAVRAIGLDRVTVAARRFEELATDPAFVGWADVVTARAVKGDATFISTVMSLVREGGRLLLFESAGAPGLRAPGLTALSRRLLLSASTAQLSVYGRS